MKETVEHRCGFAYRYIGRLELRAVVRFGIVLVYSERLELRIVVALVFASMRSSVFCAIGCHFYSLCELKSDAWLAEPVSSTPYFSSRVAAMGRTSPSVSSVGDGVVLLVGERNAIAQVVRMKACQRDVLPPDVHSVIAAFDEHVRQPVLVVAVRVLLPVVRPSAFGPVAGATGDHLGCDHQVLHVHELVPREIVPGAAGNSDLVQRIVYSLDALDPFIQALLVADDADVLPHDPFELLAEVVDIASLRAIERRGNPFTDRFDPIGVEGFPFSVGQRSGDGLAGDLAEHRRVDDTVAAEPVRSVRAPQRPHPR